MKTSSGKRKFEALILTIGVIVAAVVIFKFTVVNNPEAEITSQINTEVTSRN